MDIATMANSLEGRSPLLDHEVMEFAASLPGTYKLNRQHGAKWILKEACRDLLPPEIRQRGKMGFGIPLGRWFRGELHGFWRDHMFSTQALRRGYFNLDFLKQLEDEHMSGRYDHGYRMWNLLMLELWHENFAPDFRLS
jgi:asparagine synthase (glutamine-hydrolysing)